MIYLFRLKAILCHQHIEKVYVLCRIIFMSFLIIIPKISAQRINRKVDSGSPCRHPRPIPKNDDRLPHWFTLNLTLLLNVFIQEIIDLLKPKNSITLYINDQDTDSKAFFQNLQKVVTLVYCFLQYFALYHK